MLCLEDGVMCDPEEFWRQRQSPEWDDGWEIILIQECRIKLQ